MSSRTPIPLYLLIYRTSPHQRAHFALWTPSGSPSNSSGTKIHVVGAPMLGFALVFLRAYKPSEDTVQNPKMVKIGSVYGDLVYVDEGGDEGEAGVMEREDTVPRGELERVAMGIVTPGASKNFLAPVNNTTNRRCQEWTMDLVRKLVELGYLEEEAIDIVQRRRDPPTHGIVLRPIG